MNLLQRLQSPTLVGTLFILIFFSSCEEDLTTIGQDVIGGQPFTTGTEVYDVFAFNNNIEAVQTNKLGVYQLGAFNDPIYGKTEAQITSQIQLSQANPSFGAYSQAIEDSADTDDNVATIKEEEDVTEVYLYIPYLTNSLTSDSDNDGVIDDLELSGDDKTNPDNDTDGDGVGNLRETQQGTNPLSVASVDADSDGINDVAPKEPIIKNNFAKQVDLDSIYGNRETPFTLTVKRSTFFLRDFDPQTNFTEAEKYYSNNDYTSFTGEVLANVEETIKDKEILIEGKDDLSTEDINEAKTYKKLSPGIRIPLDVDFFQNNIINKEGSTELLDQANFKEYIRGLQLSLTSAEELMILLDLTKASIVMTYTYNFYNINETKDDTTDDTIDVKTKDFSFSFIGANFTGNAVNTFVNEAYPTEIADALNSSEEADKIYLKGGSGAYATIDLFSSDAVISSSIIAEIKANNWIINEANLVFYVDNAATQNISNIKPPRLYLFNTETNAGVYNAATENTIAESTFGTFLNYDGFLEESTSGDKYRIRITDYINNLVLRSSDNPNVTLGLMTTPNIRVAGALNAKISSGDQELPVASIISPLSTVLYAGDPSSGEKRLKLEIHYSKAN
ncbi:DUF4270 family protein [Maribacter sp.]|uniref:DUF4270 domain-containing protein n=1 Tax=Maribacter sp. TaxID=1897614 RepID=UPI0025C35613|nr:DUF4270 family protein [Maribacter sp.]